MNYYSHYEKYLFLKRHFQKKHVVNICGHEGLGKSTLARYLSRDGTAFVSLYGSYGEMRERIGECVSIVSRMGKAAPGALVVDNCELPWGSGLTLEPVFQAWSGVPDDSGALLVLVWNDAQAMERHSIPGSERVRVTGMSFADFSRSFPHLSPAERVENFAAFGGMPVALNWVRQRDALSNVLSLIEQDGYALHFPTDLMARHTREYTRYLDIMRAVASGFRTHSAISEFTGIPARELSRYLSFLTEGMAILRKEYPVTLENRHMSARYSFNDLYMLFWSRFLRDAESMDREEVFARISEGFTKHVSSAFADIALEHYRISLLHGRYSQAGQYWDRESSFGVVLDEETLTAHFIHAQWEGRVKKGALTGLVRQAANLHWHNGDRNEVFVIYTKEGCDFSTQDAKIVHVADM